MPIPRLSVLFLALATLVGCSPSAPPTFKITGKLTYRGEAVKEAAITFEDPSTGFADQAKLSPDGTFEISLAKGSYKIAVEPPTVEQPANSTSPPDYKYKDVKDVPKKYWSSAESGLSHSVQGAGEYNIDMK